MRDKAKEIGRMSGDAGAPPNRCAPLGTIEPELVGLTGKALARDAMRRLQFVVQAAGWLHSMSDRWQHCPRHAGGSTVHFKQVAALSTSNRRQHRPRQTGDSTVNVT